MILAPEPNCEEVRLHALQTLNILDTPSDIRYDLITDFAVNLLEVPMSVISFMDSNRAWFKSKNGINMKEIARDTSICGHALSDIESRLPEKRIYEVSDTRNDVRFFDNPLVTGEPYIRSCLSYILQTDTGMNIGSLCVIDTQERVFSDSEYLKLMFLGNMVDNLIHDRPYLSGIADDIH